MVCLMSLIYSVNDKQLNLPINKIKSYRMRSAVYFVVRNPRNLRKDGSAGIIAWTALVWAFRS